MDNTTLGAELVIKLRARNICTAQDLIDSHMTMDQMMRVMLLEEGVFGICDDEYEILSITQIKEDDTMTPKGDSDASVR